MNERSLTTVCYAALLACSLLACSSVEVPRERFYRLDLPKAAEPDPGRAGVLRVQDLQLGTALDSDCLLVQDGVRLEPRPLQRWIAPLDRLVTDALVLGLSRARVCELVKGAADAGGETWTLHGRIVEFAEARSERPAEARVTLELWLEARDQLVFHDEFSVVEVITGTIDGAIHGDRADAAVAALSRGLQQVVHGVVQRMHTAGVFAAARPTAAPTPLSR